MNAFKAIYRISIRIRIELFYPKSQFSDKILPGFARWYFKDISSKVNDFIVDAINLVRFDEIRFLIYRL